MRLIILAAVLAPLHAYASDGVEECNVALKAQLVAPLEAKELPKSARLTSAGQFVFYKVCYQARREDGGFGVAYGRCNIRDGKITIAVIFEAKEGDCGPF